MYYHTTICSIAEDDFSTHDYDGQFYNTWWWEPVEHQWENDA